MRAPASGEAATHLPWLSPCATSLVALARSPSAAAWQDIRIDAGAVVLVVRHAPDTLSATSPLITPTLLQAPAVLKDALHFLEFSADSWAPRSLAERLPVYRASLAHARLAAAIATRSGRCDPDSAWIAGLLAPLGWLALASADPAAVAACLADAEWPTNPAGVQQRLWGLDHASMTRRLCRRWGLPRWLTAVIGHLDLGPRSAAALGAPIDLFRTVQLAATLANGMGARLALSVGGSPDENCEQLGLQPSDLESITADGGPEPFPACVTHAERTEPPPLLRDLLVLALEIRKLREDPSLERLENDIDNLHRALREQRSSEHQRLNTMKLASLAEFAAGASHEINNPLAVISGQAQYLLNHEPDPSRQRSLHTIIGQAHRIHQILTQLMQFARPPRPDVQSLDATALVQRVFSSLAGLAEERRVRLEWTPAVPGILVQGDPEQLETVLSCLLRNAIEAAPADGWARIRVDAESPGRCTFVLEDNGSGPTPAQTEHMFDPFYSGRHAGRGRGLGLATAWQLARGQGGDVQYGGHEGGVTRFVVSLARPPEMAPSPESPPANGTAAAPHRDNGDSAVLNGQIRVRCEP